MRLSLSTTYNGQQFSSHCDQRFSLLFTLCDKSSIYPVDNRILYVLYIGRHAEHQEVFARSSPPRVVIQLGLELGMLSFSSPLRTMSRISYSLGIMESLRFNNTLKLKVYAAHTEARLTSLRFNNTLKPDKRKM